MRPAGRLQRALLEHLETVWREPDEGIWEVRGGRRHFTYSKVMAWVAFDRAVKSVEAFGLDGPLDRWRELRREIHDDVCRHGFDPELDSFVQSYGSQAARCEPAAAAARRASCRRRTRACVGTVAAIERHLLVDGFVLRYDTARARRTGCRPGEGAFLACSFWLADAYVMLGRKDDGRQPVRAPARLRNDVGLLAEEYDTAAGRQVGNFPQAFSHLALVNTAINLTRAQAGRAACRTQGRAARPIEQRLAPIAARETLYPPPLPPVRQHRSRTGPLATSAWLLYPTTRSLFQAKYQSPTAPDEKRAGD